MKGDPIMVECENCGHGHRWIPSEVERQIEKLEARIVELEKTQVKDHELALIGDALNDASQVVPLAHPVFVSLTDALMTIRQEQRRRRPNRHLPASQPPCERD